MKLKINITNFFYYSLVITTLLAALFYLKFQRGNAQKSTDYQYLLNESWSIDSTKGTDSYIIKVTVYSNENHNAVIENFSNLGVSVRAFLTNNELKIDSQEVILKGDSIYIMGTGLLNSKTICISYTLVRNNTLFKAKCTGSLFTPNR